LRPGLVSCPSRYPQGAKRNAFASLTSLLPGTLTVHDDEQGLLYHALDIGQPIAEQLAEEELSVCRVLPDSRSP
jgi:multicomponent Na+:H+ antiporter subunit E